MTFLPPLYRPRINRPLTDIHIIIESSATIATLCLIQHPQSTCCNSHFCLVPLQTILYTSIMIFLKGISERNTFPLPIPQPNDSFSSHFILRTKTKLLILVYKALHSLAPTYPPGLIYHALLLLLSILQPHWPFCS